MVWLLMIYFSTNSNVSYPQWSITAVPHEFKSAAECNIAGTIVVTNMNSSGPVTVARYQCIGTTK